MFPLWIPLADAHRPGLSYARVSSTELDVTLAAPELGAAVRPGEDLAASRLLIADMVLPGTTLSVNGVPCELGDPSVRRVEGDGIELSVPAECPVGPITYTAGFLARMEPGHRHYVESEGAPVAVLDPSSFTATVAATRQPLEVAGRFGLLGVEHIWTGYDHLLFLFALLLAAPSLRAMLLIVTGFTVAHSITLSAAALGLVHISPAWVEPAIAASIVFVGVENFWRPPPGRRTAVTFGLGLIHGFGFASMLTDLGLPRAQLVTALVSFNGGVELGQGAIVLLLLPILLRLRRWPSWERRFVPVLSGLVVIAGAVWFMQRVG